MRPKAERGQSMWLGHQISALGQGELGGEKVACSGQGLWGGPEGPQ